MRDLEGDIVRTLENATQILVALRWAAQAGHCLPHLLDDASSATIRQLQQLATECSAHEPPAATRRRPSRKPASAATGVPAAVESEQTTAG